MLELRCVPLQRERERESKSERRKFAGSQKTQGKKFYPEWIYSRELFREQRFG